MCPFCHNSKDSRAANMKIACSNIIFREQLHRIRNLLTYSVLMFLPYTLNHLLIKALIFLLLRIPSKQWNLPTFSHLQSRHLLNYALLTEDLGIKGCWLLKLSTSTSTAKFCYGGIKNFLIIGEKTFERIVSLLFCICFIVLASLNEGYCSPILFVMINAEQFLGELWEFLEDIIIWIIRKWFPRRVNRNQYW